MSHEGASGWPRRQVVFRRVLRGVRPGRSGRWGDRADARQLADLTGAFVNDDPPYVQSTRFVLDPDGHVIVSVYSSGAIGRLVPDDVAGLIRYHRKNTAQDTA